MKHTYLSSSFGRKGHVFYTCRNGPRAAVGVKNLYVTVSMSRRDSVAVAREIMFHFEVFLALLDGESCNRAYKEFKCTDKIKFRLYYSISL